MKSYKLFYSFILLAFLLSCAGSNIDKVLKQGNVVQKDFKTTIPFTYVDGWMVIKVEINDKPYNFILDTGASNIITKELAEELNSNVLGSEDVYDVNETQTSTKYTSIGNIKIGNVDFQNTIAGIVDLNKTKIVCTKIDGLIGANLMRKAVWDFDFKNQQITITNDENKLDIPAETIDSRMYIGAAGVPAVTLQINGKKVLNNTIDFGNSGTNLLREDYFQEQLEDHLITRYIKGSQKAFGAFGRTEDKPYYDIILNEMKIGGHTINNLFASVSSGAGNNIGLDFFKNYRVILNWKKKKIRMIEITKAGNDTYKTFGFSRLYENEGVYVNSVVETSSASKFLKNGDKIIHINETNYGNVTEEQRCTVMNTSIDNGTGVLSITIVRNGKELMFELLKTELLKIN